MELIFGITAAILAVIVVIIIVTHRYSDSDDMKDRRRFIKFLKAQKIKLSPKWYKYAVQLDKAHHTRIIKCFTIARELLISLDDALEAAVYISSEKKITLDDKESSEKKDSKDKFVLEGADFDKFFYCFRLIRNVDLLFDEKKMMEAYKMCVTPKKDILEPFARAWVDQTNADLQIDFETAKEFI